VKGYIGNKPAPHLRVTRSPAKSGIAAEALKIDPGRRGEEIIKRGPETTELWKPGDLRKFFRKAGSITKSRFLAGGEEQKKNALVTATADSPLRSEGGIIRESTINSRKKLPIACVVRGKSSKIRKKSTSQPNERTCI